MEHSHQALCLMWNYSAEGKTNQESGDVDVNMNIPRLDFILEVKTEGLVIREEQSRGISERSFLHVLGILHANCNIRFVLEVFSVLI